MTKSSANGAFPLSFVSRPAQPAFSVAGKRKDSSFSPLSEGKIRRYFAPFCALQTLHFSAQCRNFTAEHMAPPADAGDAGGKYGLFLWSYYIESRHFLQGFSPKNRI